LSKSLINKRLINIEKRIQEIANNSTGSGTAKLIRTLQRDVIFLRTDLDVLRDTSEELEEKIQCIESKVNNECENRNSRA
jgi:hypothetical protein